MDSEAEGECNNFTKSSVGVVLIIIMAPFQILCAASVNPATFIEDFTDAVSVMKEASPNSPQGSAPDANTSISLVWIVTGVPNLTKVGVGVVTV